MKHRIRMFVPLALLSLTSQFVGCGDIDGVRRGAVTGAVTLDGEPIPTGSIVFFPSGDNKGPSSGGNVQDGLYDIPRDKGPVLGTNRVEIRAPRKTGRQIRSPDPKAKGQMIDEWEESAPPCYNTQSTLEVEIESVMNELDFPLTSEGVAQVVTDLVPLTILIRNRPVARRFDAE